MIDVFHFLDFKIGCNGEFNRSQLRVMCLMSLLKFYIPLRVRYFRISLYSFFIHSNY